MANMTFKANLLPNSDLEYNLGSSDKRWIINGNEINGIYYAICETSHDINVKEIILENCNSLTSGTIINVNFLDYNSSNNPKLKLSKISTSYPIVKENLFDNSIVYNQNLLWEAGTVLTLIFTGDSFITKNKEIITRILATSSNFTSTEDFDTENDKRLNLNNYISQGSYWVSMPSLEANQSGFNYIKNLPTNLVNGFLWVDHTNTTAVKLIFSRYGSMTDENSYNSYQTWLRSRVSSDWTPWNRIVMSDSSTGYPNLSGLYIKNNSITYAGLYPSVIGTTSTVGRTVLTIGNNKNSITDNNAQGRIWLYGSNEYATIIESNTTNYTGNRYLYLPNYNGNMYLTHVSNTTAVGSNTLPVYVAENGRITTINYTIQSNVPSSALFTDEKVKQTSNSSNANYKMLFTTMASPTSGNTYETYYNSNLIYNPSTNKLSTGNLDLSGTFNVTGTTTLSDSVIVGGPLTTNSLTVNGNSLFNNNVNFNNLPTIGNLTLLLALGLSNALHFIGIATTTAITNGSTANPNIENYDFTSKKQSGDVILGKSDGREYVWTGSKWELLGYSASTVISSGTSNNAANIGIIGISQATDGSITATTGNLVLSISSSWTTATATGPILSVTVNGVNTTATIPIASDTQSGVITTDNLTFKGTKTFYAVEASTNFTNNVNTTGGGFYIKSQNVEYGRLYVNTQGTTSTTGIARLILGNATTTGNIGNALGSIYLYSSSGTYVNILNSNTTTSVLVKIPNYNGHMVLAHVGNTNSAIGSSTIPVYVEGNGKISAGSTYAGGTLVTLNGGAAAAGSGVSFYAPTDFGTANIQALVGNGTGKAPKWVDISPSVSITDGNSNNAPKINITVLGRSGTALALTKASTTVYGVTKLSSATNSTATDAAATPAAVKAAYDAATTAEVNSAYAGNIKTTSAATYNTEPEVKSVKVTGNSSANTSATNGVVLQYDATLKVLNFVFA